MILTPQSKLQKDVFVLLINACSSMNMHFLTAGLLHRAGAQTTPNFRENFRVSPRTIFSAVDTQTAPKLWCHHQLCVKTPPSLSWRRNAFVLQKDVDQDL